MKRPRFVQSLLIVGLVCFSVSTSASSMFPWALAKANCQGVGGTVTELGQCGGGLYFDNCVENNWVNVCFDYCTAGPQAYGNGGSHNHWCDYQPCEGPACEPATASR